MSLWGKIHRYRFRVNLAKRLNVKVSVRTSIMQLGLGEYVETVIREQGLTSVGEVLEAYCLRYPMPGMGRKSWKTFFSRVQ